MYVHLSVRRTYGVFPDSSRCDKRVSCEYDGEGLILIQPSKLRDTSGSFIVYSIFKYTRCECHLSSIVYQ